VYVSDLNLEVIRKLVVVEPFRPLVRNRISNVHRNSDLRVVHRGRISS